MNLDDKLTDLRLTCIERTLEALTGGTPIVRFRFDKELWPEGGPTPAYKTPGSAGADLVAAEDVAILPGYQYPVRTGLFIELPEGYEAQIRPRSGLAIKNKVGITNSPGTVDSDFRGEMLLLLENRGTEPFYVKRGERIAQMIIARVTQASFEEVEQLSETSRGAGGWGSTGSR